MKLLRTLLLVLCVSFTYAQTTSYYLSAEGKSGSALRSELNGIISGNTAIPYTSTSNTDTWDVLKLSDANSSDPSNVNLIYSGTATNGVSVCQYPVSSNEIGEGCEGSHDFQTN